MEYENPVEKTTVKQLLGSNHEAGQEPGIIKEYEGFIQRHAYDYLMVGFATDIDRIEGQREARFEAYLDKIESDFAMYRTDVAQWNQDHTDNADPDTWQVQLKEGKLIRREDLPPVEICEQMKVVSPVAHKGPTREQIRAISQEGVDKFFDQALDDSYGLLRSRLEAIALDLPTAPLEHDGNHPKTFSELVAEREILGQRKLFLKSRIDGIPSELLSAPYVRDAKNIATRDELLIEHRAVLLEYPKVTARLGRIEKELPSARLDDVMTRDELVNEYATIVARMSAIEDIYIERNPVDAVDNLAYLQPDLLGQTSPITEKIYIVRSLGKATADLIRTA